MIDTNYYVEALEYLLNKDCLISRYYPLIQFKNELINLSQRMGYKTKNDIANLSDDEIMKVGFEDKESIKLLRRFLTIYDPDSQKFKEIEKLDLEEEELIAYKELYYLPGVKRTRASLYYGSGYKSLRDIANSNLEDILKRIELTISTNKLSCIVPLPKEVRTHIAVAKAFTQS